MLNKIIGLCIGHHLMQTRMGPLGEMVRLGALYLPPSLFPSLSLPLSGVERATERLADGWTGGAWLPDGDSQILRSYVFGPSGLKDYGSATLRCKI